MFSKTIFTHLPVISIFTQDKNTTLTLMIDTDKNDLNRSPKTVKVKNINSLSLHFDGFSEINLEGKCPTLRGKVFLKNEGEENILLAEPEIKINSNKKIPKISEMKDVLESNWKDALSDAMKNLNTFQNQDETLLEKAKNSRIFKITMLALLFFAVGYTSLFLLGKYADKNANNNIAEVEQVDTEAWAQDLANNPEAAQELLEQLEAKQANESYSEEITQEEAERREELQSFGLEP